MKTTLLTVIAVCLVMITFKLYVPDAQAEEPRSRSYIERIIEQCDVTGYVDGDYLYTGDIDC